MSGVEIAMEEAMAEGPGRTRECSTVGATSALLLRATRRQWAPRRHVALVAAVMCAGCRRWNC